MDSLHRLLSPVSVNVSIGRLWFDIALDNHFYPSPLRGNPGKHNHIAYELHGYMSGSGTLFVRQREIAIKPRSVHLIGPNVYHAIQQNKRDPITRWYIQFTFRETNPGDSHFPASETKQLMNILSEVEYFQFPETSRLLHLIEEVRKEFSRTAVGYYASIQSLFMQLIVLMARAIRPSTVDYTLPDKAKDEQRDRIIDLFFNDYSDKLTLHDLAAHLSLSKKQTNRILLKYYSSTFKQRVLDLRMEESKNLLQNTDLPVQHIAEKIGYSSLRNFVHMFKKRTGCTPSAYRKRHSRGGAEGGAEGSDGGQDEGGDNGRGEGSVNEHGKGDAGNNAD